MTQFLPPNLLALFAPRDPIPFLPPADKLPFEKKRQAYTGVAGFLKEFEDPKDTPAPTRVETREERRERKRREKAELQAYKIEQGIAMWDPQGNSKGTSDPYRTLFVGRISYDTSESKLRREFEVYGPIKRSQVFMVQDKIKGKPRGYAFIEFEHERDMHAAYKHADGKKIDGRRVLVDVERGRTVKGWLPRRLGGGLGNTRRAKGPGGILIDDGEINEPVRMTFGGRGNSGPRDLGRTDRRRSRSRDRDRRRRSRSGSKSRDKTRRDRDDRDKDRKRDRDSKDERRRSRDRDKRRSRDKDRSERRDKDRERNGKSESSGNQVPIKKEPKEEPMEDAEYGVSHEHNYRESEDTSGRDSQHDEGNEPLTNEAENGV